MTFLSVCYTNIRIDSTHYLQTTTINSTQPICIGLVIFYCM